MVKSGRMPEQAYFERPEIPASLTFVWQAFQDLTTDRQIGMGIGPIPFSSTLRYARLYGIESIDAFERFRALICAMDDEYLRLNAPKETKNMPITVPVTDVAGVKATLTRQGK